MNAENFHEYLKNPPALYQISYQELKSLVLQYPYSPNLRYLLLVKSLLDNHKDYSRNLNQAAIHTIDRTKLFKQIKSFEKHHLQEDNYTLQEEFLELKDLSTLDVIEDNQVANNTEPLQEKAVSPEEELLDIGGLALSEEQHSKSFFGEGEDDTDSLEDILTNKDSSATESGAREDAPSSFIEEALEYQPKGPEQEMQNDLSGVEHVPVVEEIEGEMERLKPEMQELPGTLEELDVMEEHAEFTSVFSEQIADTIKSAAALVVSLPDEGNAALTGGGSGEQTEPIEETGEQKLQQKNIPFEITNQDNQALQPIPKESFNSWLRQFSPPKVSILEADLKDVMNEGEESENEMEGAAPGAKELAAKSIKEDKGLASQSLAALLEAQGHYKKAITMYERLRLQYPQKSSLFAAKIENLKSKL